MSRIFLIKIIIKFICTYHFYSFTLSKQKIKNMETSILIIITIVLTLHSIMLSQIYKKIKDLKDEKEVNQIVRKYNKFKIHENN